MKNMIQAVQVTHHYGIRPVLQDVSFSIASGELVVVIGPNGVGKTTLLNILGGVMTPLKGHVEIDGKRRRSTVEQERAIRRQAVFLPDRCWLPTDHIGREYLHAIGNIYGIDLDRRMQHMQQLAEVFSLDSMLDQPIRSYSQGQQHKLALCGALLTEASLLIWDEPFGGGLDPAGIHVLKSILRQQVTRGKTVVLSSPVPEVVEDLATRFLIIKDIRLFADATLPQLQAQFGKQSLSAILADAVFPEVQSKLTAYLQT